MTTKTNKKKKVSNKYFKDKTDIAIFAIVGLLVISLIMALAVNLGGCNLPEIIDNPEQEDIDADYDANSGVIDDQAYSGTILQLTDDGGRDYIDNTLFLGDSNTARFLVYKDKNDGKTFTTKNNSIGVVSMGVGAISSLKCMQFSTGTYAMPDAVSILQPERVIITFGTNNLSGTGTDATSFIETYEKGIKAIQDKYPSVDIIVNAIPPVAKNRAYPNITMTQIDAYNKAIVEMCEKNDWKYLNSSEALKDSNTGYAKEGYTASDGLHLSQDGLQALFDYIRTHTYITDDDRPKPLATIPTVIGVPSGLIQSNPLGTPSGGGIPDPGNCDGTWDSGTGYCACNNGGTYNATDGCAAPSVTPSMTPSTSIAPVQTTAPTPPLNCDGTWDTINNTCICNNGGSYNATSGCVVTSTPTPVVTTPEVPATEAPPAVTPEPATPEPPAETPVTPEGGEETPQSEVVPEPTV